MEISKICPKCKRDYSGDPYWKSSLKKHLERKNPCDRKDDEKYKREFKVPNHMLDFKLYPRWMWNYLGRSFSNPTGEYYRVW